MNRNNFIKSSLVGLASIFGVKTLANDSGQQELKDLTLSVKED